MTDKKKSSKDPSNFYSPKKITPIWKMLNFELVFCYIVVSFKFKNLVLDIVKTEKSYIFCPLLLQDPLIDIQIYRKFHFNVSNQKLKIF